MCDPFNEESTLIILKPDSVRNGNIGAILSRFEKFGFRIKRMKMNLLDRKQVEYFYTEHRGKPFWEKLIEFMTSGNVVVCVISATCAVCKARSLIGETDPKISPPGTIRADFAQNIDVNAIHASDSRISAHREIAFFFEDYFSCQS